MSEAPRVSLVELRGLISDAGELAKGTQIADGGALLNLARYENKLFGEAKGSGQAPYRVSLQFGERTDDVKARCSCMAARSRPFCKHAAGLLVSWARSPESFVVSEAPPVLDSTAQKKRVKTGKVSGTDLMSHGVERVTTLVRELAVAGVAAAGVDRVEQVRQLGEALRENRLRRLSARTLELAGMLDSAVSRRAPMDAVAYAGHLSDMLLTARKLEKHLAGEALDDRYVEELIGKTWRSTDRTPVVDMDLVEYAFVVRSTADNFMIRESRFVDLRSGGHYTEKQILPAFLAKRTEPKRSYARTLLKGASGGLYPGFAPQRLDLETIPTSLPLEPAHAAAIAGHAHPSVSAAIAAFQAHRTDIFAPDVCPMSVCAELIVAHDGRLHLVDGAGDAVHLPGHPRLDDVLIRALQRGRLRAAIGEMTLDGILATFVPMALVIETPGGADLVSVTDTTTSPALAKPTRGADHGDGNGNGNQNGNGGTAWLDRARRAGVPPAAIALGEVRLEMADALATGLASLVARVTDPLVSRLGDLGLAKPAALLGELPRKADLADRLDGFVKVYQVTGIALVRLASASSIVTSDLERLPAAESIAFRRPAAALTPAELVAARVEGRLTRYEAAWHRARHIEAESLDTLLEEWPRLWSDGEVAPLAIRRLAAEAPSRAVEVARQVLSDDVAGQTAHLTAVRLLREIGGDDAAVVLKGAANDTTGRLPLLVRAHATRALPPERRKWRAGFAMPTLDDIEREMTREEFHLRMDALEELERLGDERMIPRLRQVFLSDPDERVREAALVVMSVLGDSESFEALLSTFRNRSTAAKDAAKEAKRALGFLATQCDVRVVPDLLQALLENWAGTLPAEALKSIGIPALEPILSLVVSRPELASRKSLQQIVWKLADSPPAERLFSKHAAELLETPDGAEKALALLKLAGESIRLRAAVGRQVLTRITAPSGKIEQTLVRAAKEAVKIPS